MRKKLILSRTRKRPRKKEGVGAKGTANVDTLSTQEASTEENNIDTRKTGFSFYPFLLFLFIAVSIYGVALLSYIGRVPPSQNSSSDVQSSRRETSVSRSKPVFINWRTIYWGDLQDLIRPDSAYRQKIQLRSPRMRMPTGREVLQDVADEIRQGLRAFERRNGVKIVWNKPGSRYPDVTAQFIDFLDKGCGRAKNVNWQTKPVSEGR